MIKTFCTHPSWIRDLSIFSLVWLIGLVFGAGCLVFYYPSIFHSDGAMIQVLARAMADEMSLVPHDYFYGNQLMLFRANPFIAVALKLGLSGYTAYAVGSSVSFSFYFVIAFVTLETLFRDRVKSLLFTGLLFLPIGLTEADYVIGQQSHLANMVFALVIVVQAYRVCWHKERFALVVASLVVFLMSLEEPIRVLLVLVPLLFVILAYGKAKQSRKLILVFVISFLSGYVCNRYLVMTHFVFGLPLRLAHPGELFERAGFMIKMFAGDYIGLNQLGGMPLTLAVCVQYSAKILVLVIFFGIFCFFSYRLVGVISKFWMKDGNIDQSDYSALEFIGMVGFIGTLVGFCLTASIIGGVGADVRNFLWSLQLCKLIIFVYLLTAISCIVSSKFLRYIVLLVFAAQLSCVAAFFLYTPSYKFLQQQTIEYKKTLLEWKIQELMLTHGVYRIYGCNFWKVLRLEVLIPPMKAGVLDVQNKKVYFSKWLVRPSMRCVSTPVLYLFYHGKKVDVWSEHDQKIAHKVVAGGGKILFDSGDFSIYFGYPVWDMTGCN